MKLKNDKYSLKTVSIIDNDSLKSRFKKLFTIKEVMNMLGDVFEVVENPQSNKKNSKHEILLSNIINNKLTIENNYDEKDIFSNYVRKNESEKMNLNNKDKENYYFQDTININSYKELFENSCSDKTSSSFGLFKDLGKCKNRSYNEGDAKILFYLLKELESSKLKKEKTFVLNSNLQKDENYLNKLNLYNSSIDHKNINKNKQELETLKIKYEYIKTKFEERRKKNIENRINKLDGKDKQEEIFNLPIIKNTTANEKMNTFDSYSSKQENVSHKYDVKNNNISSLNDSRLKTINNKNSNNIEKEFAKSVFGNKKNNNINTKSKYLKKTDIEEKVYNICFGEIQDTLQTSTFYNEVIGSENDKVSQLKYIKKSEQLDNKLLKNTTTSFSGEKHLKTESKIVTESLIDKKSKSKSKKTKKSIMKSNVVKEKLFNDCDLINCFYLINTLKTDVDDRKSIPNIYNRDHNSFKNTKSNVDSLNAKLNNYSRFQLKKIKKCYNLLSNLDITESDGKNLFAKNYLKYIIK